MQIAVISLTGLKAATRTITITVGDTPIGVGLVTRVNSPVGLSATAVPSTMRRGATLSASTWTATSSAPPDPGATRYVD
ncbi:hypothetical protein RCH22_003655 [Cryobacterium psychrotolerans]|nr:hypothetical protein [Cryobacterium psychrotolerans]